MGLSGSKRLIGIKIQSKKLTHVGMACVWEKWHCRCPKKIKVTEAILKTKKKNTSAT